MNTLRHLALIAGVTLLWASSLSAQVEPGAVGGAMPEEDDARMNVPPLLAGTPYANAARADIPENVFTTTATVNAAYMDNVFPGGGATPVADTTISIDPRFSYDRSTPRQDVNLNYSPSFTFYTPTSQLNGVNQSAEGLFEGRLTRHLTLSLQDNFLRTSNIFDESYPFSAGALPGSTQAPIPAVIAPFAEQLRNAATADVAYQFSRNGMVGGGATFTNYSFPNPADSAGLYNSGEDGGSAFYNRRVTSRQYVGVTYEYNRVLGYPPSGTVESQTQSVLPFYSVFFSKTFSVSAAAGPVRWSVSQPEQPTASSWTGATALNMSWQGDKGNLAASFLRTVTSGGGLIGAFTSVGANFAGAWKFSHAWSGEMALGYQQIEPVNPLQGTYGGGKSVMAQASVVRTLGEHATLECGYQHFYEQFEGIAAI
ncbi:MAG: hypothetical protein WBE56_11635, partial [Terracidiphilus sp.]